MSSNSTHKSREAAIGQPNYLSKNRNQEQFAQRKRRASGSYMRKRGIEWRKAGTVWLTGGTGAG